MSLNEGYAFYLEAGVHIYAGCVFVWQDAQYVPWHLHSLSLCFGQKDMVNSSPPGQNGRYFAGNIFKCIFMNEIFIFGFKFPWSMLPRDQLTIIQHWFRWWLGNWTNAHPVHWCIYAALGGDESKSVATLLKETTYIAVHICWSILCEILTRKQCFLINRNTFESYLGFPWKLPRFIDIHVSACVNSSIYKY